MAEPAVKRTAALRAAALVAYLVWPALMMTRGWTQRESHGDHRLLAVAIGCNLVAMALVARPLWQPSAEFKVARVTAVAIASLMVLSALLVGPLLSADALIGHQNWVLLASPAPLCGLVLRRAYLPAALLAAALVLTNLVVVMLHYPGSPLVRLSAALMMSAGPLMGVLLPLGPVLAVDERGQLVEDLRARTTAAQARAEVTSQVQALDATRREQIAEIVRPVLEAAAVGRIDTATRDRAAMLARQLRDDLRARPLWTTQLRRVVDLARARGVTVSASCDRRIEAGSPAADATVNDVRDVLLSLLPNLTAGTTVRCRISAEPEALVEITGLPAGQMPALSEPQPGVVRRFVLDQEPRLLMISWDHAGVDPTDRAVGATG